MTSIEQCVQTVRRRQQQQWVWVCVSWGLLLSSIAACALAIVRGASNGSVEWYWVVGVLTIGPAIGGIVASFRPFTFLGAARTIDQQFQLKDRTQTALAFIHADSNEPLHRLQILDTEQHLKRIDPAQVIPVENPREFPIALVLSGLALVMIFLTGSKATVLASVEPSEAVIQTAATVEENLEELKKYQEEQPDPELEKLINELNKQVEELKEVGMDPKEALARLSSMEASMEKMQQQAKDPSTEAKLQEVGETLSLAESLSAAGQAMAKGQMEKAASKLEKAEMPELDLKTEKAITEQLNKIAENEKDKQSSSAQKKSLSDTVSKVSEGLSQGNRSKFQDGMKQLASECKKQGQKKKLADLLRKQCQCLGDCKSQCENECNSKSESENPKKGGTKAGTSKSGNQPGEKKAILKGNREMNIKGQDSGEGDVDVETEDSSEQEQQAARQHRKNADKLQGLSESALDSESIPLGQRQTIRRYFESIRPSNSEIDQVNEASKGEEAAKEEAAKP